MNFDGKIIIIYIFYNSLNVVLSSIINVSNKPVILDLPVTVINRNHNIFIDSSGSRYLKIAFMFLIASK